MALHVTVLDASRHQAFLKQHRIDPVTHKLLEPGDRVVACAHCQLVFLEGSWEAVKGRSFGHGTDTLPEIEVENEPFHFRSQRAAPPTDAEAPSNGNETTAAHAAGMSDPAAATAQTTADEPHRAAGPLRMREIPFRMREIPFSLREISEM